ncbi:hypothetical protein [Pontibacter harenae]|uniref:hypothetical protein n=1 Tax=Pontibacter harenae TaxID=2894083 RepID=UPI001E308804|nr:hypothetical protein [Pontibacter harenae]MCC9168657.1 hypothetical protein [Pontibacter harenae]
MVIDLKTSGFLNVAAYNAQIGEVLKGYEDLFNSAEKLTINLSEVPAGYGLGGNFNPIKISVVGKEIIVTINFNKFFKDGRLIKIPSPKEVYEQMTNVLDITVKEYQERFSNKQ